MDSFVHSNQEAETVVIAVSQLAGRFAGAVDSMLGQLVTGRGIDRIANPLGTGGGRDDVELALQSRFFHQVFHYKFGHRAAAYIAVANKKYLCHCSFTPPWYCFPQQSTPHLESRGRLPDGLRRLY
jgi:hypothetical protein